MVYLLKYCGNICGIKISRIVNVHQQFFTVHVEIKITIRKGKMFCQQVSIFHVHTAVDEDVVIK